MIPLEYKIIFFGAPRVAEGDGVTIMEGQGVDSTILVTKMSNDNGGIFFSDGGLSLGGIGWSYPPLKEPVSGRVKDIETTPRVTSFTLELGTPGVINIKSNCKGDFQRVINIYWDKDTDEVVIQTEETGDG